MLLLELCLGLFPVGCLDPAGDLGDFAPPAAEVLGQGTGLGLHTVHTIVNRTGGQIKVESGPEGTTFIITFPVS